MQKVSQFCQTLTELPILFYKKKVYKFCVTKRADVIRSTFGVIQKGLPIMCHTKGKTLRGKRELIVHLGIPNSHQE